MQNVASDMGLHCLPMSHKKTLGSYGLNEHSVSKQWRSWSDVKYSYI